LADDNDGPLAAINVTRGVQFLPDGTRIPHGLAHTLLVLATYAPNIWPAQHQLAADLKISRRNLNYRLATLEAVGFITRVRRGRASTLYLLHLSTIRRCWGVAEGSQEVQTNGTTYESSADVEERDYMEGL
jgi:biotin operon repressor